MATSGFDEKLREGIESREGPVDEEKEKGLQTFVNNEIALKVKFKGEEDKASLLKKALDELNVKYQHCSRTIGIANDRLRTWEDYGKRSQRKIADKDKRIHELEEKVKQSGTNDAEYMKLESELVGVVSRLELLGAPMA
ncbi:hypothetical protein NM208_g9049 [Fusarium decemcellulare]|uniref:Uncharacterized protein n=1 Tax=Fusarium decemcellulare TaxID=57161 RepID=A0ACC1S369_9HYPO|nr:hypothetical protein NM208_g9049 [Fusarium decemcellulare]